MEKENLGRTVIILILIAVVIYLLASSGVLKPVLDKLPRIEFT